MSVVILTLPAFSSRLSSTVRSVAFSVFTRLRYSASCEDVAVRVHELTGGHGADVVFELVGTADTGAIALACLGKRGALVYIGYSFDKVLLFPLSLVVSEQRILTSVGNRRSELVEALELAASGRLRTVVTTAPLADAAAVLEDLRAGRVVGRAVLVP